MSPWLRRYLPSLLIAASGAAAVGAGPSGTRPVDPGSVPRRIVSLNLCADQYVVALADRAQIAGLTRNAADPDLSAVAGQVRGLPMLKGAAEEVLAIDPDLVIGAAGRRGRVAAAPGGKRATLGLKPAESYAEIIQQIRTVAAAVGHPDRGEALVARMGRALGALPHARGRARVAAYYQRRGYMTGTGTLVDELMGRVGLANLAGRLHKPVLSQLTLEELIAARPDYLIVESASDRVIDQGTEMLHHPLLAGIPRLRLPQAWTVCGGPAYIDAARSLARQIAATPPGRLAER